MASGPANKPGLQGHDSFANAVDIDIVEESVIVVNVELEAKKAEELKTDSVDTNKFFRPDGLGGVEAATVPGGGGGGAVKNLDQFTATAAQTVFNLANTPLNPTVVVFKVNGVSYKAGVDYLVISDVLTWQDILFTLESGDEIQIDYTS